MPDRLFGPPHRQACGLAKGGPDGSRKTGPRPRRGYGSFNDDGEVVDDRATRRGHRREVEDVAVYFAEELRIASWLVVTLRRLHIGGSYDRNNAK